MLKGPNTWFPLTWIAKKQSAVSRSTTEAELISMAYALFSEALPMLNLWDRLLKRPVKLRIFEDNEATIKVVKKGYSAKLKHVSRTHKVNIASLHEKISDDQCFLECISTNEQAADVFTKALEPAKWPRAMQLLHTYELPSVTS